MSYTSFASFVRKEKKLINDSAIMICLHATIYHQEIFQMEEYPNVFH